MTSSQQTVSPCNTDSILQNTSFQHIKYQIKSFMIIDCVVFYFIFLLLRPYLTYFRPYFYDAFMFDMEVFFDFRVNTHRTMISGGSIYPVFLGHMVYINLTMEQVWLIAQNVLDICSASDQINNCIVRIMQRK